MRRTARALVSGAAICVPLLTSLPLHAGWIPDGGPICIQPYHQQHPVLVSDGAGGAILAWEDARTTDFNIYLQRVNALGNTLWSADGIPLCDTADVKAMPLIVSDGAGGAIIVWMDRRHVSASDWDIYAQRVDADGNRLWSSEGVIICDAPDRQEHHQVIEDGAGGAIIVWSDQRGTGIDLYAQRIDGNGAAQWPANGITVCSHDGGALVPKLASDGAGGAIIVWEDSREVVRDIYAQRVGPTGAIRWPLNGVPICTADEAQHRPNVVPDGAGGAIVAWEDQRDLGTAYIYAQRLNANGSALWMTDGIPVCDVTNTQNSPQLVSDRNHGAIVVWRERGSGSGNIHAQRLNEDGDPLWTAAGVDVCSAEDNQSYHQIVPDGHGGVIIVWKDERDFMSDIYAQRLDADGASLWTANGAVICDFVREQESPALLADGNGGAFFVWADFRSELDFDLYASRAEPDGHMVPTMLRRFGADCRDGTVVVTWSLTTSVETHRFTAWRREAGGGGDWKPLPVVIKDRDGSYSFADSSGRPGSEYRYRVEVSSEDGVWVLFESDPVFLPEAAFRLYPNHRNPFPSSTRISYYLAEPSVVSLSVFDVSGRLVSRLVDHERKPIGRHLAQWNGQNESGGKAASGVYFYRLRAGSFVETRKMTLVR